MYIYPDNMKGSALLFLWRLTDMIIIVVGAVVSIAALAVLKTVLPATIAAVFAFISIRFDDTCIFDYIVSAFKYCVSTQQFFLWRWTE